MRRLVLFGVLLRLVHGEEDPCALHVEINAVTHKLPLSTTEEGLQAFIAKNLPDVNGIGCSGDEKCILAKLQTAIEAKRLECHPATEAAKMTDIARNAAKMARDIPQTSAPTEEEEECDLAKALEDIDAVDLTGIEEVTRRLDEAVSGFFKQGHSGDLLRARKLYKRLAALPCIRRICEIGFNVGHSAIIWLDSKPDLVVAFDFFDLDASQIGAAFLRDEYNVPLHIVPGPSSVTVPAFAHASSENNFFCDLLIVDGGHSIDDARSDLLSMRRLANPNFHLLLVDDIYCSSYHCIGPTTIANEMIHNATLSPPLLAFTGFDGATPDARGVALFQYL